MMTTELLTHAHVDRIHDCIFPPSYFLLPFAWIPSIYFFHLFHAPTCVPTYLRLYFVAGSSPSAKPISSHPQCHIHVYIPSPPSIHTSVVPLPSSIYRRALDPDHSRLFISPFSLIPTPTPLRARRRPWLPKTNGYILVTCCFSISLFLIRTYI